MFRWLFLLFALIAAPATAQLAPRENAIRPELVAEGPATPGGEVELAIVMHTRPGWHGYWLNPGDAGLPMTIEWQLPTGVSVQIPAPVSLSDRQRLNVPVSFTANNEAQPSGSLIFNVVSDEHPLTPIGQVTVNYTLSEAKPFVTATPSFVETGLSQGGSQIESVLVQNKGLQDALNLRFTLTRADGSAAPSWASIGSRSDGTMAVGEQPGNVFGQGKNVPAIAMAHGIPYVATATVGELRDLEYKVKRAMTFRGARYLHIFVPCPLGWGHASDASIRIGRLVKETGLFPVFEAEQGEVVSVSKIRKRVPVEEYLKPQRRFAHLFSPTPRVDVIARIQAIADRNIRKFGLLQEAA